VLLVARFPGKAVLKPAGEFRGRRFGFLCLLLLFVGFLQRLGAAFGARFRAHFLVFLFGQNAFLAKLVDERLRIDGKRGGGKAREQRSD